MGYEIKAYETEYKGHLFRSRLEARWAAMFDFLGWRWTYEPFDLGGWSPDFMLHPITPRGQEILVEVKGPESEMEACKLKIQDAMGAYDTVHGEAWDVLILRESWGKLHPNSESEFGELAEIIEHDGRCVAAWGPAIIGSMESGFDFCHMYHSYHHRLTGFYDGSFPSLTWEDVENIEVYWGQAHQLTRWIKGKK